MPNCGSSDSGIRPKSSRVELVHPKYTLCRLSAARELSPGLISLFSLFHIWRKNKRARTEPSGRLLFSTTAAGNWGHDIRRYRHHPGHCPGVSPKHPPRHPPRHLAGRHHLGRADWTPVGDVENLTVRARTFGERRRPESLSDSVSLAVPRSVSHTNHLPEYLMRRPEKVT